MISLLITGGTGSLGRAIVSVIFKCRQFSKLDKIIIYSRDEHKQEQMYNEFKLWDDKGKLRFLIGDIRDKDRLALATQDVNLIIHAAALKIIPTAEFNPMECLKTNVLGTQNLIDVAINYPCIESRYVLLISTDKAVKPKNLYGASKLCAEKLFLAANNLVGQIKHTKFSVARYGNVANSNGSVIPAFQNQIKNNGQINITHPDMTRFWITLEDAAKFVLDSLSRMQGNEIFTPSMPSFKITDLATAFGATKQNIVGIRPGEKIHEEIIDDFTSDKNDWWLGVEELKTELSKLGVLI